jgi:hypothetical protein
MGGACSVHEAGTKFCFENQKGRVYSEDLGIDERMILK